ncbi:MAG: riboflavin kinase [bacterium]|nr:riboflavin kinase [bacterium]
MLLVKGRVIRGEGYGGQQGYPTANLDRRYFQRHPVPSGVYAAWAELGKNRYQAIVIIGVPFVRDKRKRKIEVYLLDYTGNARGRQLEARIVKKIRPIKTFSSQAPLLREIRRDVSRAKKILRDNQ